MAIQPWLRSVARAIVLLLCVGQGFAATNSVEKWDTERGLPQNSVFTILQTKDGYLWAGTGNGLARFDGLRFKTFDEGNTPGLSGNRIVKLFEDSQTNLWIATEQGRVAIVQSGNLTNLDFGTSPFGPVTAFAEDGARGVWMRFADNQVLRYREGKIDVRLTGCGALFVDASNLVWVAARDFSEAQPSRLRAIGPVNSSATFFTVAYDLPAPGLDFVARSRRGGYWRIANGRVEKWNRDRLEKDLGAYPWRAGTPVTAMAEDLDGNPIVGTYGDGVYWFDKVGHAAQVRDLSHSSIFSVLVDREGTLWVGTDGGGLNRVKKQAFQTLEPERVLTVKSVSEDTNHGIWFSINNGGVSCWRNGEIKRYGDAEGLPAQLVNAVFADRKGGIWVGCENGVFTLSGERFARARGSDPRWQVSSLYQDSRGVLWVGTQQGLAAWNGRFWALLRATNGLSQESIRAVVEDRAGGLWIGTESGGLNHMSKDKIERIKTADRLANNKISSLWLDNDGVLWVGTAGGLGRFSAGKWSWFIRNDGLINNNVGFILEDNEGYLWLGSTAGLMRIEKRALNNFATSPTNSVLVRTYGVADGLPVSECYSGPQPGACRASDGTLWFPTIRGLAFVNPSALRQNTNPPPVVIEDVTIDEVAQAKDVLRAPTLRSVTVPAGKSRFEIEFTSLNLSAPEKGRIRYRLLGLDDRWIERPGDTRSVPYIKLPPKQYVFEVKACNEDWVWSQAATSLVIRVLPPFWRTWWFLIGSTIVLLGIVIGSVHYVSTQRLHRQLESLRQQEALEHERARIARDLHDQLGANLTQVALLGEMAEADKELPQEVESHARQISQTARETTHALDEIVWTVNPSNDTLNGLINYVCKYAQEYFALADLRYRLEVPPNLPTTPISPELRHNVFLAAKESVNNVVKHAKATSAWLRLKFEPDRFTLEIEDNGRGLSADAHNKGRSGLKNMLKRMEDIGGSFEVLAGAEGGTLVRLMAPL